MSGDGEVLLASRWPAGECHFCGIDEDRVDGDRVCWLNEARSVCNRPPCIGRFQAEMARRAHLQQRPRKRTPAEIHELIREEERQKRRRYREAAKARKGRVA